MKGFRSIGKALATLFVRGHLELFPIRKIATTYTFERATRDARAGANLALVAFPQTMAVALIAGLPIEYGLLGFIAASILGPLFASSRFNSFGPTNTTAVLVMSVFVSLQMQDEHKMAAIPVLVLMSGIFLIIGAYMRVAKLIQYVSRTVITGYITAAALLIIANQVQHLLGIEIEPSASFFSLMYDSFQNAIGTHIPSLVLGLLTVGFYLLLEARASKLPNVAVALVVMSIAAYGMHRIGWSVETFGALTFEGFSFGGFQLRFAVISQLATAAMALAFLTSLETNSSGKSLAARAGDRFNPNQELFALGIANTGSALIGGMPASASLTRSLLNLKSGAATALGSVWGGLIVAILLVSLSGFVGYIPKPAMAALIIAFGFSLISKHQIRVVSKATQSDAIVFYTTLGAGLLFTLDAAIYLGAAVSIILFLRKVSEPELVEYGFNQEGHLTELEDPSARSDPEISIVHVEGELFFGAADLFYDQIRRVCEDPNLKVVILKMRNAHHLDATAVMALEELVRFMRECNRTLLVSEARKDAVRIFKNSGLMNVIGRDHIFPDNPNNPTLSTARALKAAKGLLGGQHANVRIYVDSGSESKKKSEKA